MTKTQTYTDFSEGSKPRCRECRQPLTFVRTRSQEKKWYCYTCEKYTGLHDAASIENSTSAMRADIIGLQVVDSHGMIVGRVARMTPSHSGDVESLLVRVDNEHLRTSLGNRGISEEVEIPSAKVIAIGDVVILSDVFSSTLLSGSGQYSKAALPSVLQTSHPEAKASHCPICATTIQPDARFCIACGRRI